MWTNLAVSEDKDVSHTDRDVSKSDKQLEAIVTDGTYAQELLREVFPVRAGRNVKAAIGEAFEALKRRERALPKAVLEERKRQWTERRVRSLWEKRAPRIDHYEIQDLTAVAVEEARVERQRQQARDTRLAAIIAAGDARQDQPRHQWLGRRDRGLDHASRGVGRTADDEHTDQSQGWGQ